MAMAVQVSTMIALEIGVSLSGFIMMRHMGGLENGRIAKDQVTACTIRYAAWRHPFNSPFDRALASMQLH